MLRSRDKLIREILMKNPHPRNLYRQASSLSSYPQVPLTYDHPVYRIQFSGLVIEPKVGCEQIPISTDVLKCFSRERLMPLPRRGSRGMVTQ